MQKRGPETFLARAKEKYGDRYCYDHVVWNGWHSKVRIICQTHGERLVTPYSHIKSKNGCWWCGQMTAGKRSGLALFIKKSVAMHGDRYDYSSTVYRNSREKVVVKCKAHGDFLATPANHVRGAGCPKCSKKQSHYATRFLQRSIAVHGTKYRYDKAVYKNSTTKVCVICPRHGEFRQTPCNHINGSGCPSCGISRVKHGLSLSTEEFTRRATERHDGRYDYSLCRYTNSTSPVAIICPSHGLFKMRPASHLRGSRCPMCNATRGEEMIHSALRNLGIQFEVQKIFPECRLKNPLKFDVWVESGQTLIEFDGEQHFGRSRKGERPADLYESSRVAKREFAKKMGYRLVEIPHWDMKNIPEIVAGLFSRIEPCQLGDWDLRRFTPAVTGIRSYRYAPYKTQELRS